MPPDNGTAVPDLSGAQQPPADGLLDKIDTELRLGLKHDVLGDLGLASSLRVGAPFLRQIQRPAQRQRPALTDGVQRHGKLAVADLAQRPGILALDPRGALAVLDEPRVVQHPRLDADHRGYALGDVAQHHGRIPRADGQELLHALVVGLRAQALADRLKRLARPLLKQPAQVQATVGRLDRTG